MASAGWTVPLTVPLIAVGRKVVSNHGARNRELADPSGHRVRPSLRDGFAGTPAFALSVLRSDLCAQLAPLNRYGPTALGAAIADALIAIARMWRRS